MPLILGNAHTRRTFSGCLTVIQQWSLFSFIVVVVFLLLFQNMLLHHSKLVDLEALEKKLSCCRKIQSTKCSRPLNMYTFEYNKQQHINNLL